MNSLPKPAEFPIAGADVPTWPAQQPDDPFRALDELMAVVEAFCPVWPERKGLATRPGEMRL